MQTRFNPILDLTDSYKMSQWEQYPPGTEYVYSYIESRGGENSDTIFFGLQAFLREYLSVPVTKADIEEAALFAAGHGEPFNRDAWESLVSSYGGYYPVRIRAVPEGTLVPTKNVICDIVNTDPEFFWLTSYIETALLRAVWYPTTVATRNFGMKRDIAQAMRLTSDSMEGLDLKLNDFGARGASSLETARIGGLAHLAVFTGTDNMAAVRMGQAVYDEPMAGFSIPASEHSTMTSWGRDAESAAYLNMVEKFANGGILAVVSDSYDLFNAVENFWGGELLETVKNSGATIVVRPDSGDPVTTPVQVIELLMEKAGYTTNSKGYKVLPDYFRVIQGDGIGPQEVRDILDLMARKELSADNIVFGMGGGMLQKLDRDTQRFAMKCSAVYVNGKGWVDVFKDPVTDPGKASKKGRLDLKTDGTRIYTDRQDTNREWKDQEISLMQVVYNNGVLENETTLSKVRERINKEV